MPTQFFMLRHGQTDWNLEGRYQGQLNIPLNETGLQQAKNAAASLIGQSFDQLYSSDLTRAVQTAQELAKIINLPIQTDIRLREIHQGEWEGRLMKDVLSEQGSMVQSVYDLPYQNAYHGGETIGRVADRVWSCLGELAARHSGKRIVVVAHGLAIATVFCKYHGIPLSQAREHIPENCAMICVEWLT